MHGHGGLPVLIGREFLGLSDRDRRVAGDDLFRQPAHGLNPEGQGRDIKQQGVRTHGQGLGLQCGAHGDDLVRVDIGKRFTPEQFRDLATDQGNAGRAANQNHALDVVRRDLGVVQNVLADAEGAGNQGRDQFFEGRTVEGERLMFAAQVQGPGAAVGCAEIFLDLAGDGDGLLDGAGARRFAGPVLEEVFGDGVVEIVTAKRRVAACRQNLENALFHPQQRDVESPTAQIVNGVKAFGLLIQAIGQRRRRRFVDQAQNLKPRQPSRVLGRRARRVVEIGGHGDDGTGDLAVEHALGPFLQGRQDVAGNLHRRQFVAADVDAHHGGAVFRRLDLERQMTGHRLDVVDAAPHQTFDGADDAVRAHGDQAFRQSADDGRAVGRIGDDGRHQGLSVFVTQHFRLAVDNNGGHAIGGAQVDADGDIGVAFMGGRGFAGFVNLQQCHGSAPSAQLGTAGARVIGKLAQVFQACDQGRSLIKVVSGEGIGQFAFTVRDLALGALGHGCHILGGFRLGQGFAHFHRFHQDHRVDQRIAVFLQHVPAHQVGQVCSARQRVFQGFIGIVKAGCLLLAQGLLLGRAGGETVGVQKALHLKI